MSDLSNGSPRPANATAMIGAQPVLSLYAGPRIWVGLALALVAALAHLASLALA